MYIKVRRIDNKQEVSLDVSKLTRIEELKFMIKHEWSIEEEHQKLFHCDKLLEEGYKLFDYNVNTNDVIIVMVTKNEHDTDDNHNEESCMDEKTDGETDTDECTNLANSLYYKVGDKVDYRDRSYGAWFEAKIHRIYTKEEKVFYKLQWEFSDDDEPFEAADGCIRPRAYKLLSFNELEVGRQVMINHNIDEPEKYGFWYDFTIAKMKKTRTAEELCGTLHIGFEQKINNCTVNPKGEIYAIEEPPLFVARTEEDEWRMSHYRPKRRSACVCNNCNDIYTRSCKKCGCKICGGKHDPHALLLCDECNYAHHLQCLDPPLAALPEDDYWYCSSCTRNGNKSVKKKEKTAPGRSNVRNREMISEGFEEECTIVPRDHKGPVPGVEVGTLWLSRSAVSLAGIHRPYAADIHGRASDCAYSILLSGSSQEEDNGDEFIYTGSAGRDSPGNKGTSSQSRDQTLTRLNKALALNCDAALNNKTGATAKNWKNGIPVRVVREQSLGDLTYRSSIGYRYDGLYKVVEYFPQRDKNGFVVWRYLLRRDDPAPAPWTREGAKNITGMSFKWQSRTTDKHMREGESGISTPLTKKFKESDSPDKELFGFVEPPRTRTLSPNSEF